MIERFLEPGVIIAFITLAGVLVGNLLQRRSSKEKNAAELKAVEANLSLIHI